MDNKSNQLHSRPREAGGSMPEDLAALLSFEDLSGMRQFAIDKEAADYEARQRRQAREQQWLFTVLDSPRSDDLTACMVRQARQAQAEQAALDESLLQEARKDMVEFLDTPPDNQASGQAREYLGDEYGEPDDTPLTSAEAASIANDAPDNRGASAHSQDSQVAIEDLPAAPMPGSPDAIHLAKEPSDAKNYSECRVFFGMESWESLLYSNAASKEARRENPRAADRAGLLPGGQPVRPLLNVFSQDSLAAFRKVQGDSPEHASSRRRFMDAMDEGAGLRIAPALTDPDAVRELAEKYPNFATVANDLADRLALLRAASHAGAAQYLKLPNLLLSGPPGVGKTAFCRALARALGVPFSILSCHASMPSFMVAGMAPGFTAARPGRIFEAIANTNCANPLILLDELDKISLTNNHSPLGALLAVLEEETAEMFTDEFIGVPMDTTGINFIATANDSEALADPLRSRLVEYVIQPPTAEQARVIAASIYSDTLKEKGWGNIFDATLREETLAAMLGHPPRELRAVLERAMARAARDSRWAVLPRDFEPTSCAQSRPMGFI